MATETKSTLDGLFKEQYGPEGPIDLVPEVSIIASDIKFSQQNREGDSYNFPVRLRRGNGWTFAGGSDLGTAFTLNAPTAGVLKNATVSGTEFVNRTQIPYGVITRSEGAGAAFSPAHDEIVYDMTNSAAFAREMCLLYGGTSSGTIESQSGSGATRDFVISKATWAPTLWAQMDGASIDAYDAPGGTKLNTTAPIVITAIDVATRTISVSGVTAELTACIATSVLVPLGADGAWFDGIDSILTNTGSLFGISAATYNLWKGSSKSAGSAAATMATFTQAQAEAVVRGGTGKMTFYVSPYTWTDIMNDTAALRRTASGDGGSLVLGHDRIGFKGVGGDIDIVSHPLVKAGEAFGLLPAKWKRIGSSDLTFRLGVEGQGEGFYKEMPDAAGYELRNFWHQGIICCAPAQNVKITGIVNNSL